MQYLAVAIPRAEFGTRAEARTKELERCLKMKPDWILMIDSDQTLPITLDVEKIQDYDVVVFDAPNKGKSDSNVFYHPDKSLDHFTVSCCFLRPSFLESIPWPWFRSDLAFVHEQPKDGKNQYSEILKATDDNVGEDVYFSRKLLEAKARVLIVPDIQSKHFDLH